MCAIPRLPHHRQGLGCVGALSDAPALVPALPRPSREQPHLLLRWPPYEALAAFVPGLLLGPVPLLLPLGSARPPLVHPLWPRP